MTSLRAAPINDAYELLKAKQYDKALAMLVPMAESGDPVAQFYVGNAYYDGLGVSADKAKGIKWLVKAATQGSVPAQRRVGLIYLDDQKNPTEAELWLSKAADGGDLSAAGILGSALVSGKDVNKNPAKGIELLRKAAASGDVDAQYCLGDILFFGHEGKEFSNLKEGFEWLKEAAESGDRDAQRVVGYAYVTGKGVSKNLSLAYGWLLLAVKKGDTSAQELIDKTVRKVATRAELERGASLVNSLEKHDGP